MLRSAPLRLTLVLCMAVLPAAGGCDRDEGESPQTPPPSAPTPPPPTPTVPPRASAEGPSAEPVLPGVASLS